MSNETTEPAETVESLTIKLEKLRATQAGIDRAYNAEKKRADALEARMLKAGSEAELLSRLDKIQKAYADKERKLELQYYTKSKCLDAGISYDLFSDIELPDEMAIERKIAQFSEGIEAATYQAINAKLLTSSKPQAGNMPEKTVQSLQDGFRDLGL
jgi:hypothetical protein